MGAIFKSIAGGLAVGVSLIVGFGLIGLAGLLWLFSSDDDLPTVVVVMFLGGLGLVVLGVVLAVIAGRRSRGKPRTGMALGLAAGVLFYAGVSDAAFSGVLPWFAFSVLVIGTVTILVPALRVHATLVLLASVGLHIVAILVEWEMDAVILGAILVGLMLLLAWLVRSPNPNAVEFSANGSVR